MAKEINLSKGLQSIQVDNSLAITTEQKQFQQNEKGLPW